MKKRFNVLLVSTVIFGLVLSLFGMALASQATPAAKNQSWHSQAPAPVHATNIKVMKKMFIPEDVRAIKGKPTNSGNSGKNKTKEGAATGVLGNYPVTGTKYAIVIGICDYPGTDYDLCESDGDSLHMYKALTTLYGYLPENVYLFKDMGGTTGPKLGNKVYNKPTRNAIYDAITTIKDEVKSDDEVTFFFSGHGTSGNADDGDNELTDEAIVVHDDDGAMDGDDSSELDFIWDGELRSWFSGFATTRINFVFDSCLAGGMNDVATDLNGDIIDGRIVSMATDETHSAYVYSTAGEDVDGDEIKDGEGVFTRLFANEGMLQGLADTHNYSKVDDNEPATVEEAFDYAKNNIPHWLKRRQKPTISDKFTNDLLL